MTIGRTSTGGGYNSYAKGAKQDAKPAKTDLAQCSFQSMMPYRGISAKSFPGSARKATLYQRVSPRASNQARSAAVAATVTDAVNRKLTAER